MKKSKQKLFALFLSIAAIFCGYIWIALAAPTELVPSPSNPLLLYSNQSRNDLQTLFAQAIKEAKNSLHISMYALTDPYLLSLLNKQAKKGVKTTIFYDPTATTELPLNDHCFAYPIHLSGALMHRKILIADNEKVFIGSANFTTTSLKIHDNLVAGIFHPELAHFLTHCESSFFNFTNGELWLLPSMEALERLIKLLQTAKNQIYVAMFTLTHPRLTQALIDAHERKVDVRIAVDHYTAEGASLSTLNALRQAGIPIHLSSGQQLFHHKWALIDQSTLVLGSANWTKAAFTHNQDCFIILPDLASKQKNQIKKIWEIIELESIEQ